MGYRRGRSSQGEASGEPVPRRRFLSRLPVWGWALLLTVVLMVALLIGSLALAIWADITVGHLFFDSLGMGAAYDTTIAAGWLMAISGLVVAAAIALPVLLVVGRKVGETRSTRTIGVSCAAGVFVIVSGVLVPFLVGHKTALLAARNAVPFGTQDPIFGKDPSFLIFTAPLVAAIASMVVFALVVPLVVGAVLCAVGANDDAHRRSPRQQALLTRGGQLCSLYGGLMLIAGAAAFWFWRYASTSGGDDLIAGAGEASRTVGIPTRTVVSVFMLLAGVLLMALALPAVRRRFEAVSPLVWGRIGVGIWVASTLALVVMATPWWLVLLVPALVAGVFLRPGGRIARALDSARQVQVRTAIREVRTEERPLHTPAWMIAGYLCGSVLFALLFAPIGTSLYDNIVLRGSTLQVERPQIEATLAATRQAAGLDAITTTQATYTRNGVTREAIDQAPASVSSLRFLSYEPVQSACKRLQAFNRYYTCADVDLDRYPRAGVKQTMFVMGREVDYAAISDFQRRHFAFTHGNGVIMAPVNQIDSAGRPAFVVGGLPVKGLEEPLTRPEIYFGAQPHMPWAVVNTKQPDGFTNAPAAPWSGPGIPVKGNKLAITVNLGGLPFVGGGRKVWNNLSRGDAPDAELLLYRDLGVRLKRLAPFLKRDADPYFVVASGRLWVMQNAYTTTGRYPYSARFDGVNYQRHAVTAIMDAYSGETHLYVMDPTDPIIRTWQKVYPSLFSAKEKIPPALVSHLRYGEDQFNYQAAALGRFHVTDVDQFFNNDDAWTVTTETVGTGANGQTITSPARFTYAVKPGETDERFLLMGYFKPATKGRGIGFASWLTADNDPGAFGKMSLLRFNQAASEPLDSVDTFAANVGRDPDLSAQIGVRKDQILRGNAIVVPVGEGLLYVQPLYLDTESDSLPTLWQVVVSFGDGRIYTGASFKEALDKALLGHVAAGAETPGAPLPADIKQLVLLAADEFEAYRAAFGAGRDAEASAHLQKFNQLMAEAKKLAQS